MLQLQLQLQLRVWRCSKWKAAPGEKKGWGLLVEAGPSLFVFVFVSMCPGHVDHHANHVALWGHTESLKKTKWIRDADGAWRTSLKSSGVCACVRALARRSLGVGASESSESREPREVSLEGFFELEKTRILPHPLWLPPAPALLCDSCNGSTRDACWTPIGLHLRVPSMGRGIIPRPGELGTGSQLGQANLPRDERSGRSGIGAPQTLCVR